MRQKIMIPILCSALIISFAFCLKAAAIPQPKTYSEFELLPELVQYEIAKNLLDKDLLHLAITSKRENKVLQEEMRRRPAIYWHQITTIDLGKHQDEINALAFSHDGKWLVSGSGNNRYPRQSKDNSIIIWDMQTKKMKKKIIDYAGAITSLAISPDNKTLASSSSDETVRLWDLATGNEKKRYTTSKESGKVTFSHDGKHLAFIADKRTVTVINVETGREQSNVLLNDLVQIAFSADDTFLAIFQQLGCFATFLWNLKTNTTVKVELKDVPSAISGNSVAFSPDIRLCAVGCDDSIIRFWQTEQGKLFAELKGHKKDSNVISLAFSHNGNLLASGGSATDWTVRIWNMKTHREIAKFSTDPAVALAFSPDDKTLAAGFVDGLIKLYNAGK